MLPRGVPKASFGEFGVSVIALYRDGQATKFARSDGSCSRPSERIEHAPAAFAAHVILDARVIHPAALKVEREVGIGN